MRGLLITTDFPPVRGGLASLYSRISQTVGMDEVMVLTLRTPAAISFDALQEYPILRIRLPQGSALPSRLIQMLFFLLHSIALTHRSEFSTVHIGHLHLGVIGIILKRLRGIEYILYLHGGEMGRYARAAWFPPVAGWIVRHARAVVVNSMFTQEYYAAMGIRHPRTEILAISAPIDRFRPGLDSNELRPKYGLDGHRVILTVGRLIRRKGHDTILRALVHIRRLIPDIRYLIVGHGPEETPLRALAKTLGVDDCVVFAGAVPDDDLPYLYAACDVFAMPSRMLPTRDGIEGLGIVFLEAAASGKPTVATRSGGIQEAVVDGVTGILIDPDNPDQLASAVTGLLLNPGDAVRLGLGGRERAERLEADWQQQIRGIWQ